MTDDRRATSDERASTRRASRITGPSVELHIQELVLDGFAPQDGNRIGAAVEAELVRLLGEQGVPPSLASRAEMAYLDGGAFEVAPGSGPEVIGTQVARAVFGGLAR